MGGAKHAGVAFLGSEASAAAYRLAGVATHAVTAAEAATAFGAARRTAGVVLVEASIAAALPVALWRSAVASVLPLVLIVPDLAAGAPMPDLAARLRRQLGLGEDA